MTALLFFLWACTADSEKTEAPEKPVPVVRHIPVAPSGETAVAEGAQDISVAAPVDVNLAFAGISKIHRGFFLQSRGVQALGQALGRCFDSPVTIEIGYSNESLKGYIYLVTAARRGACVPILSDSTLNLSPLKDIGTALAAFRDFVAGTSDFRISNFKIGVRYESATHSCAFVAKGQNPPDGTTWASCPEDTRGTICPPTDPIGIQFLWRDMSEADSVKACF